jgi:nucleotide-binding universal stress UspA family protein
MLEIATIVQDPTAWTAATGYAVTLAAATSGSLTAIHAPPAPLPGAPLEAAHAVSRGITAAGRKVFCERAARRGAEPATWLAVDGYMPDILLHACSWVDLVVLARDPLAAWGSPTQVGQLVLASGGACVVVPPDWREGASPACVMIGWNGSPEAIRATRAALPLLRRAGKVVVLSGTRRSHYMANWDPPFDLSIYLARHGIAHEVVDWPARDEREGDSLLAIAHELGADLLVMGAYGRTRFSEWMFGGATREVLHEAPMPVLMQR